MRFPTLLAAAAAAVLLAGCGHSDPVSDDDAGGSDSAVIEVLSNRADLISGGDALVELLLPEDADATKVRVELDGRNVFSAFARRADGRVTGR